MSDDLRLEPFANIPGYRLIDFKRVGLPVYGVYMDVLTEEKRSLHLVSEYCLRLVDSGVRRMADVIALLGLSANVVRVALADLLRTKAIAGDEDDLKVAPLGRELLSAYGEIVCTEAVWVVPFDGILRKPFAWQRSKLLTQRQLLDAGHSVEVAPFGNRPVAKDLTVDEVSRVLSELRSEKATARLIAIRNVRRAPLRFVAAVQLAYVSDAGFPRVSFLVDGRPLDGHDAEFVRAGGMKRPSVRKLAEVDEHADQLRAKAKRRLTRAAGGVANGVGRLTLRGDAAHEEDPVKIAKPYMMLGTLEHALETASNRIVVTSRGISSLVVDERFVNKLASALARGVSIFIGLGPNVRAVASGGAKLEKPIQALHDLQSKNALLKIGAFAELPSTHLLVDESHVIVGEYDWLSPDGSSLSTFKNRWLLESTHPAAVAKEFARIEPLMRSALM